MNIYKFTACVITILFSIIILLILFLPVDTLNYYSDINSYAKMLLPLNLFMVLIFLILKYNLVKINNISTHTGIVFILLLSFATVSFLPIRHYLHNDELFVLHQAKEIANRFSPVSCFFGKVNNSFYDCYEQSSGGFGLRLGYPTILAIIFKIFGSDEIIAHTASIFVSLLNVSLVYLIANNLVGKKPALIASSIVAFLPEHLWLSTTTNSEIFANFFLLLGIYFLSRPKKISHFSYIFAGLISTYISVAIRLELLPISVILSSIFVLKIWNKISYLQKILIYITATFTNLVLLLFILVGWRSYFDTDIFYGVESYFGVSILLQNVSHEIAYHVKTLHVLTALLLIYLFVGAFRFVYIIIKQYFKKGFKETILNLSERNFSFIFLYFIPLAIFLIINSYVYSGYPNYYPTSIRFVVLWASMATIPFALFIHKKINGKNFVAIFVVSVILYSQYVYPKFVPQAHDLHYVYERNIIKHFQEANPSCLYISDVPYYELYNGYSSIGYIQYINELNKNQNLLGQFPCTVFVQSMRCGYPFSKECNMIINSNNWQIMTSDTIDIYTKGDQISQVDLGQKIQSSKSLYEIAINYLVNNHKKFF